jgi:hypothetical protein
MVRLGVWLYGGAFGHRQCSCPGRTYTGVPVKTLRYDGMIHGFFTMVGDLDTARAAVLDAAGQLRGAFA